MKAKEKHMGRYVAVNLENDDTIEFRLFWGTLRYKTFIATLQLVDEGFLERSLMKACSLKLKACEEKSSRNLY